MKKANVFCQAIVSWTAFILCAVVVLIFYTHTLSPRFPVMVTEIFSVVAGVFFAAFIAFWFLHKGWFPSTRPKLYVIGSLWVGLTVAFQVVFSLIANGDASALLDPYRIDQGSLFPLLLVALLFIPMAVAQRNEVID